jgi:hypothetical protein
MRTLALASLALLIAGSAHAQTPQGGHSHQHGAATPACTEPTLACATAATPFQAADGTLWLTWVAAGRVAVATSRDGGTSFGPPVLINKAVERVDTGPDARPRVVVNAEGHVFVSYAVFKDRAYNADAFVAVSEDGGKTYARHHLTDDTASQRFEALALGPDGKLFTAWIDKRNAVAAKQQGKTYDGAALAFGWLDSDGLRIGAARIAQDNSCECCRLGVAFKGSGQPVVLFRNIFAGSVRDHAITTFSDPITPGPIYRVSVDDWKIDACPHHGPSLAIAPDGSYHVAWFTDGRVRQGTFYAHSRDGGRTFSAPLAIGSPERQPGRPFLLAVQDRVWLAWKEFDGAATTVSAMVSRDAGDHWSTPAVVARTDDASDHPLLVSDGTRVRLSWLTQREGYRLLPLEDLP